MTKQYILWTCLMGLFTYSHAQHVFQITGGKVKIQSRTHLVLNNTSWGNSGGELLGDSGVVHFKGIQSDTIGGNTATTFGQLYLDKNGASVELRQMAQVKDSLDLTAGKLKLEDQNLRMLSGSGTSEGSAGSYVQSSGTGQLQAEVGSGNVLFPIGGSSYRPAILQNNGSTDFFGLRVTDSVLTQGNQGSIISQEALAASWFVEEENPGGSSLDMSLQWNGSDEQTGFDRANAYISSYSSSWDIQPPGPASGSDPYQISRANLGGGGIFAIFSLDTEDPVISCPANIVQINDPGDCGAVVTYTAPVGTDNSPGPVTNLSSGLGSGAFFPVGISIETYTVSDAAGNTDSCSFTITVNDTEAPVANCPGNIAVNNDPGQCGAAVTYTVGTADNCPGESLNQTGGLASGSSFPVGTTTNSFTVTDAHGNSASCSFDVTVSDNENPTVTCPANIAVNNDPGQCGAAVTYTVRTADNCPGESLNQTAGLASGGSFPIGTTTNSFTVTDASGNSASCSFDVTVSDNENPTVTCPANIAVNNDPGQCGAAVTYTVGTADNCPGESLNQTSGFPSGSTFPIGTTTNSFTVTDASGNSASCSFDVTVSDNENPTVTCPANIAVNNDPGQCGATISYTVTTADNCPGESLNQTGGLASGGSFPIGTTTNSFTVTDASGNSASCSFDVTVSDNENPTVTCPANIAVNNDPGQCGAAVTYAVGTADNCPGESLNQTAGLASGSSFPVGTTTNSFTVTDAHGNSASCSFDVTVSDNENPTVTCPANIAVNNDPGQCGAAVTYAVGTADNCPGESLNQTAGLASGGSFPIGTTTNSFTVTDASGNSASCSFDVTVSDNENPTVTCPANIAVNNDPGQCGAAVTYAVGTADNCPGESLNQTSGFPSGSTFPIGTTTNSFTVTDASGNSASCSFDVTVSDNENPTVTCPANIAVNNDPGQCGAAVTYTVGTADNCPGESLNQTGGLASGSSFPVGTTTNSFTVTDAHGNSASCSFDVTVSDNENPTVTCPANIAVNNDPGQCGAAVTYAVGTADNCPGESLNQTGGLASGGSFPIGTTTNSFTVTDASGNSARCSFDVTVSDNENPTVTCPANIAVNNDPGQCGAAVTYTVGTADNCPGESLGQTGGLASGGSFPIGTTTNSFTVTDAHGNSASCSFDVTVSDNENPTVTCPANIAVNNDPGQCGAAVTYTVGTADNCPGESLNQTGGLASGSSFPVGTTTNSFTVTDASGNSASCSFTVTVSDTTAPVISCPSNIVVSSDAGQCGAVIQYSVTSTDNCPGDTLVQTVGLASGSRFPAGTTTNSFTASDASGNSASCSFTVSVSDTTAPVITLTGTGTFMTCQFEPYIDPGYLAIDNCGADISQDVQVSGTVNTAVPGIYTLYYDVSDQSGNAAVRQSRMVQVLPAPRLSALSANVCAGTTMDIASLVRDYNMRTTLFEFYTGDIYSGNASLFGASASLRGVPRSRVQATIISDTSFWVIAISQYPLYSCPDTVQIIITARNCGLPLSAKVALEGAYDPSTGVMRDRLRSQQLVPATEPYSTMGYVFNGGGGDSVAASVLNMTGNDAIVDWVIVEVRSASNPAQILESRAGLLQADGDIVATDGGSALIFDQVPMGNYYVAVLHRNHLGVMTGQPVALDTTSTSLDFSDPLLATYGSGQSRKVVQGKALLFGGDADGNGQVQNTDNVLHWMPEAGTSGYRSADFNLDGQVQNTDRVYLWMNNAGKGSTVPR